MENLHKINEVVDIREFLVSFSEITPDIQLIKDVDESIRNDMNLDESEYGQLKELCDPNLLVPDDLVNNDIEQFENTPMQSVDYIVKNYGLTTKHCQPLEQKFMKNLDKLVESGVDEENLIKLPDVAITIQITQSLASKKDAHSRLSWMEEFYVLGQSKLVSLKDSISCFRNEQYVGEFSENLDELKNAKKLKECIGEGFIFIESTFYSDTREGRFDSASEIADWAREKQLKNVEVKDMSETCFADLKVKLGYPYLFRHLGTCEHLIIFMNIKIVNPRFDCFDMTKYPIVKDRNRGRFVHCWLCNVIYARWIICNSSLLVDDPSLLCERCLKNTHYDQNKKKLCDFKAYHLSQLV